MFNEREKFFTLVIIVLEVLKVFGKLSKKLKRNRGVLTFFENLYLEN